MLRWIIVTLLALVLISGLIPFLRRFGLGGLPGDLAFRAFGRNWYIPLGTSVVLTLVASGVSRLI